MITSRKHQSTSAVEEHPSRSDTDIVRDVRKHMKADFEVPDDRIEAHVVHGAVTLTGAVQRRDHRTAAEACVRKVPGVREIDNRIIVDEGPDA